MQAPEEDHKAEVLRLRRIARDLTAISTLPAIWGDLNTEGVVKSLSNVLLTTLDLDLVFIRLANPDGSDLIETVCGKQGDVSEAVVQQVRAASTSFSTRADINQPATIPNPFGDATLRTSQIRFGAAEDHGIVFVASRRSDFPSERDRLLLQVGANQAAVVVRRQRAEQALQLSETKTRALFDEMAKSNKNLSEFLAVLAHELRNPLAPILTGLEVMRLRAESPEIVSRVREMIERQANQMVHLLDDLLDMARVANGKIEIRKKLVDLNTIVSSAVETSLPAVEGARHQLGLRLCEEPLWLNADATRVAQIVGNLLTNAAKYTPPGGRIKLSVEKDGSEAIIAVSDTGIGIAPESLPTIFEMFSQVGNNTGHSQGGLGIGLALVRNLASLHGGTVTASSDGPGKGSNFIVRLPLAPPDMYLDGDEGKSSISAAGAGSALRILVADDNMDAAHNLAMLLKMVGHEVRTAHDGLQALQIATDFHPQIAFLDIGMPGMTGHEVSRELRKTDALKTIKIVAVTGWGSDRDRQQSKDAGFDKHIVKPLSPAAIYELLREVQQ